MPFSLHLTLVPLVKINQDKLTTQISKKNGIFESTPMKPILKVFTKRNERFHSAAHTIPYIKIMVLSRISPHFLHYLQSNRMSNSYPVIIWSLITANRSAPCQYPCVHFYGYILLADERNISCVLGCVLESPSSGIKVWAIRVDGFESWCW